MLHGASYDEAYESALAQSAKTNATFLHAFDDEDVIAGQGTLGLEIMSQNPAVEVIVAAVGGGGLIAGIGCAAKARNANVEIIGAQTARLPSMKAALQGSEPVGFLPAASTMADSIAVRKAGRITFPLVRQSVDRIVTVEEDGSPRLSLFFWSGRRHWRKEPGQSDLPPSFKARPDTMGRKSRSYSGGNLDVNLLSRIIEQGMVRDGRRLRLRVRLPDYPGALEGLAAVIARANANIVETLHNRAHYGVSLSETAIDITMETRGRDHASEVLDALRRAGYEFSLVE